MVLLGVDHSSGVEYAVKVLPRCLFVVRQENDLLREEMLAIARRVRQMQ